MKVVNNTDQTLFFHQAVFHVSESRSDLRPVPLIRGIAYGMYLPLINVGWGPMIEPLLRFTLSPGDDAPAVSRELEWHFEGPDKAREDGSLSSFFADAGVDLKMLERLRLSGSDGTWHYLSADSSLGEPVPADGGFFAGKRRLKESEYEALKRRALGPFKEHYAVLRGTLEYTQNDIDGTQRGPPTDFGRMSHLRTRRWARPDHLPGLTRLRSDGRDYMVSTPISQALGAGEADRFLLRIAAERSSLHDFKLQLLGTDGITVTSSPMGLELFVSTLDAERGQQQSYSHTGPCPRRRQPSRK